MMLLRCRHQRVPVWNFHQSTSTEQCWQWRFRCDVFLKDCDVLRGHCFCWYTAVLYNATNFAKLVAIQTTHGSYAKVSYGCILWVQTIKFTQPLQLQFAVSFCNWILDPIIFRAAQSIAHVPTNIQISHYVRGVISNMYYNHTGTSTNTKMSIYRPMKSTHV